MLRNLHRLALGDALSSKSRERLIGWLVAKKTGDSRLRAEFRRRGGVGDKTCAGNNGTTNDVAVAWCPGGAPLIVSAYYTESGRPAERRDAVLAAVGRFVTRP
jgi:beta-lactamase class A